jgi:hypothetical protein
MSAQVLSDTIGPSKNRKELHRARMREVAENITTDPPSWLFELLSDFSFDVASAHAIDTIWPTRGDLSDSLAETGTRAIELSEALRDSPMVGFLLRNSEMESEAFVSDLFSLLSKLATSARQARNSRQLAGPDGQLLRGRGKARLPGNMPPKYACAAIIGEVWAFFHHDTDPAPSNRGARTAAHQFYNSWIQPAKGWGNNTLNGWGRYFKAISDPDLEPLRKEVRRHLNIRSNWAALMQENNVA